MRSLREDIKQEVKHLFEDDYMTVMSILSTFLLKHEQINTSRVIRCVIFLSEGNIVAFKNYLECARIDPRDVIFWAEYENLEGSNLKRLRDFSKPFGN
ncbi:hypothetical protein [Psychroserpens luteolus]|uniref:hypothetical protein n=1 Tax=Psychroserpens luteolus TaxID=2855840 RepID=UPI001E60019D|nr:hypothetical protein [Psychroserpens luteolus]MCD2259323.1 hypothetical protein [Psychroserpens luteolus]